MTTKKQVVSNTAQHRGEALKENRNSFVILVMFIPFIFQMLWGLEIQFLCQWVTPLFPQADENYAWKYPEAWSVQDPTYGNGCLCKMPCTYTSWGFGFTCFSVRKGFVFGDLIIQLRTAPSDLFEFVLIFFLCFIISFIDWGGRFRCTLNLKIMQTKSNQNNFSVHFVHLRVTSIIFASWEW